MSLSHPNLHPLTMGFLEVLDSLEATKDKIWNPQILGLYTRIRELANSTYDVSSVNQIKDELSKLGVADKLRAFYGNLYQRYEQGILAELQRPYTLPSIIQGGGYVRDMLELCFNEYRYVQAKAPIKMLFIGSGAIPFGIIYYFYIYLLARTNRLDELALKLDDWKESCADEILIDMNKVFYESSRTDFCAVGVDNDQSMVTQSRILLADLKFEAFMSIIEGRAEELDYPADTNLILVAGNTISRQAVLKNILSKKASGMIPGEVKIILRTVAPGTLGELFYEPFGITQIDELCNKFPNFHCLGVYPPPLDPAIYATTHVFILK